MKNSMFHRINSCTAFVSAKTIALLCLLVTGLHASAQVTENKSEYRTGLEISKKLNKQLSIGFMPQFRFNESFNLKNYLFEGSVTYKPLKYLSFEADFRYLINPRETKVTEYCKQYSFLVQADKKFGNLNTAVRLRYANDIDEFTLDEQFIRYKISADYNIPKCKLTPEIAVEAYQQLGTDVSFYKIRYSAGVDYKLFKKNSISLTYKLDYHLTKFENKHILNLTYKLKL